MNFFHDFILFIFYTKDSTVFRKILIKIYFFFNKKKKNTGSRVKRAAEVAKITNHYSGLILNF